jgi:hypothetical protein
MFSVSSRAKAIARIIALILVIICAGFMVKTYRATLLGHLSSEAPGSISVASAGLRHPSINQ